MPHALLRCALQLWDVSRSTWQRAATLGNAEMQFANCLSFERSLSRLVAGCGDRAMRVWDLNTGGCLHVLRGHTDDINAHQFDANTCESFCEMHECKRGPG
jgi:WD40 repeat protein